MTDLSDEEMDHLFTLTDHLKQKPFQTALQDKVLGLIFSKSSTRTRVSFEVGITQLGGRSLFLAPDEIQLGRGETIEDTASVLGRYLDGAVIRTYAHQDILTFAAHSKIPVINGLTDLSHPCQILTDIYTIREKLHTCKNKKIVFFGDCSNNVAYTWIYAAALYGLHLVLTGHPIYQPKKKLLEEVRLLSNKSKACIELIQDPLKASKNADVLYTDVWTSMGQEKESNLRKQRLMPWQVNENILKQAKKDAIFMHCLPAHRGEEVTAEVIDGKQSVVFDQAENRLHVQKAILTYLFT